MSTKKLVPVRPSGTKPIRQADKRARQKKLNSHLKVSEKIGKLLDNNQDKIFWISFGLTLLSGFLLFDVRVTISGDDSSYIVRAADFIQHFTFPSFQGPLYPIVLSPFVGIFGIRVVFLKLISLFLILGFTWFIYQAFKNRIPSLLLTSMLFLVSVNSYLLYYASQTYSEALFMFLQALTFFVFFNWFVDVKKEKKAIQIRRHIVLALCVLSLVLTRSIGVAAVFAIAGYFLFKGQWKNLLCFIISFVLVVLILETIKYFVWKTTDLNFTIQIQSLMDKDYYNPAMGRENFTGLLQRFASNSNHYISNYLYTILGLQNPDNSFAGYPAVTILTYIILLASVIFTFKKNNYLFFTSIYTIVFLFFTFLIANTYWGQYRFIIPYIPMILLILLASFYFVLNLKPLTGFKGLLSVLVVILFILSVNTSIPVMVAARQVGNKYSGLTPAWNHYCKISEWASVNLPKDALVACRKPSISFIYAKGKRFYGIMRIPARKGDSFVKNWQQKHLPYYLVAASSFQNHPVSNELYFTIKKSTVGIGYTNEELGIHNVKFCIMDFPDSIRTRTLEELSKSKIDVISNIEAQKFILNDTVSKISIVFPDSLLQMLVKAKVIYVLTANLHGYQTVEQFIGNIEFKYPKIRTKIMQIGEDNDDPAFIYKLNYDSYDLK
jgi:hypothetical protein